MAIDVISLDHIHVYSAAPDDSATFYIDNFGAAVLKRDHNSEGDDRIFLAVGKQILVIGPFPSGITSSQPPDAGRGAFVHGFGVAHFGLRVADIEAAVTELRSHGVRVTTDVVREDSGLSYAYLAAPDGVMIELTQY